MKGKVKSPIQYRKEVFEQIKQYINQNSEINNIILSSDINQDIALVEVQQFFTELKMQDIHYVFNRILMSLMDNTYKRGLKPIDIIAISPGIIECIEGCTLLETYEIVLMNH